MSINMLARWASRLQMQPGAARRFAMSTLVVAFRNRTSAHPALSTGLALAVTVAVFYALCTLVWLAAPGPFLGSMNSLFHGMDFTPVMTSAPFSWGGFVEALLVMSLWAFLAGTFFGWLRLRLVA
jgi:hypothetical protein